MKKVKLLMFMLLTVITFSSCQKGWESLKKSVQVSDRNYEIKQYSGGVLIATYKFRGTLNDSEGSDGYYFYNNGVLYEISGDLIIMSR